MTRINVVPVDELSDQHLIAEYRELPRVIKQDIDVSDAPEKYCLGKGHMKWARKHWAYCFLRFNELVKEMHHRGFKTSYTVLPDGKIDTNVYGYYVVGPKDVKLNIDRLVEKYKMKPNFYRWTKREKPKYMEKAE